MKPTLCSLISWKRPHNIAKVIEALRRQTVPTYIALVACAQGTEFALPPDVLDQADIVFTVDHNLGPCSRFIPPLMLSHEYDYTFFAVDDHLPGPQTLAWMLDTARILNGEYCTIGQDGRRIVDGEILKSRGRMRPNQTTPMDVITSSELCPTRWIREAVVFRDQMASKFGSDFKWIEDDLILCLGLQLRLRQHFNKPVPCYLTPEPPSELASWRMRKLYAPHALCARENHWLDRNEFVRQATEMGWQTAVPYAEGIRG